MSGLDHAWERLKTALINDCPDDFPQAVLAVNAHRPAIEAEMSLDVERLRCGNCGDDLLPFEVRGHLLAEGREMDRTPHRGDPILLYQERRTVLDLIRRDSALLVVADDDAGLRIERYADRLVWDDDARAWRAVV